MPDTTPRRYFEDIAIGETYTPGTVTFTEAEIVDFARRYDPQPVHLDDAAGGRHFDGIIASGWHTAAACMRPFASEVLADVAIVAWTNAVVACRPPDAFLRGRP